MAQKGSWNLVREKVLRERGELPKEVGDVITEYKATHDEKCLSSWLREDGMRERRNNIGNGQGEQRRKGEKRKRKGEKRRERNGDCYQKM